MMPSHELVCGDDSGATIRYSAARESNGIGRIGWIDAHDAAGHGQRFVERRIVARDESGVDVRHRLVADVRDVAVKFLKPDQCERRIGRRAATGPQHDAGSIGNAAGKFGTVCASATRRHSRLW